MPRRPRPTTLQNGRIEWAVPYNAYLFKEMPRTYQGDFEEQTELADAEASLYGWWWRFLKAKTSRMSLWSIHVVRG